VREPNRRGFLIATGAAAAPLLSDLSVLAPVSRAAAGDTRIEPGRVRRGASLDPLVTLIRTTPRDRCIPVFVEQLRAGLSYQDFLAALLLATIEHGDPHQFAGVYSAHRVSSEARVEERLLPLFWALDRIVGGFQEDGVAQPRPKPLTGEPPRAGQAAVAFREAMVERDPNRAEHAILVLARNRGPRQAMSLLWEHGARRVAGSFGHHPIMVANTWRTLEALGWQHAEPVLRYLARVFALPDHEADRTYEPNRERVRAALPTLPADWAVDEPDRGATLEIFGVLRRGDTDAACDLIGAQLASGRVKAGAAWDAIHLVAAEVLVRYRRGGTPIGGSMIHSVTSTNALRCGFQAGGDDRVRLWMLLQAAGVLGDLFVAHNQEAGEFRDVSLLDLKADVAAAPAGLADIFAMLPNKTKDPSPAEADAYRSASDAASRAAFALLQAPAHAVEFARVARGLLCAKATRDPHDLKYPVAAFEDTALASPEWRPYLLAASVHALHGTTSADSPILTQAREALK
jgi:hypothetical protein